MAPKPGEVRVIVVERGGAAEAPIDGGCPAMQRLTLVTLSMKTVCWSIDTT